MATDDTADREVVITRVFDAPARLLFQAYSRPEHLMKWFGPVGWPLTLCEVDFRVGGRERVRGTWANGRVSDFDACYHDIVPDRRIDCGTGDPFYRNVREFADGTDIETHFSGGGHDAGYWTRMLPDELAWLGERLSG